MNTDQLIILCTVFFLIAVLYSSVGFGGGSSYLAVLALLGVNFMLMKSIALLCNIVVVSGNLFVFKKSGFLNIKKAAPLVLLSVPLAFLGGIFDLHAEIFFVLLGLSLIAAAILLFLGSRSHRKSCGSKGPMAVGAAAGLGFLSGLVGIGGGIFLSPVLNLLNWDNAKSIAATASFFILVNSAAGLTGHFFREAPDQDILYIVPLLLAVIIGGQIGSRITAYKLRQKQVKMLTGMLVLIAGIKILSDHLPKAF